MFKQLIVLGLTSGTIYRVDIPRGRVDTLYNKAGPEPAGVVVENGIVYCTTTGTPTPDPSADDGFDFSARNGGLHSVWLDDAGARDVIPTAGRSLPVSNWHPTVPGRCTGATGRAPA